MPYIKPEEQRKVIGREFGFLTIRELLPAGRVVCDCRCGSSRDYRKAHVVHGKIQSCGCNKSALVSEKKTRHGQSGKKITRLYRIWKGMIRRCCNENDPAFPRYGGRGVMVCDRWRESFENFLVDMGEPPSSQHSIDRYPNQDGNYEPGNCRWATSTEQQRNRRNNHLVTFAGETLTISGWAEKLGIGVTTLGVRLRSGWSVERALTTPVPVRRKT